jgi:hypothetical protein
MVGYAVRYMAIPAFDQPVFEANLKYLALSGGAGSDIHDVLFWEKDDMKFLFSSYQNPAVILLSFLK